MALDFTCCLVNALTDSARIQPCHGALPVLERDIAILIRSRRWTAVAKLHLYQPQVVCLSQEMNGARVTACVNAHFRWQPSALDRALPTALQALCRQSASGADEQRPLGATQSTAVLAVQAADSGNPP